MIREEAEFNDRLKKMIREVLNEQPPEERKKIFKEAIDEWLEKKYADFGKWSVHGIMAAALGALGYFIAVHSGWLHG